MPIRVMSYDFSSYDRDILRKKAENKAAGHEADYAAELWPEQKLCPVVTLVLYFGAEPWSGPTSLVDMLDLPDNLKGYVSDYHINLVQVAFLEDEVISKFQSDFQVTVHGAGKTGRKQTSSSLVRLFSSSFPHRADARCFLSGGTGLLRPEPPVLPESLIISYTLKQLPPMNSLRMEFLGISSLLIPRK
ncbi:MAG: Rpn family recombination-promoting nuclease/putative transposase [Lachnospiraceae bacterium]|nr:Rpn family recombination-promoting nuclease/putative transposase [Lachnospiraceae bacterium]